MNSLEYYFKRNPSGVVPIGKPFDVSNLFDEIGTGLKNAWYTFTGQTEKTSAYKAMMEREDTAYQRAAADMAASGLSKYAGVNPASSSAPPQASDPVSKSIQLASALLDLKGQSIANQKSEAEVAHTNASTDLLLKEGMTFEEKFAVDMANKQAQTFLFNFQSDIARQEGQVFAEKFAADLEYTTARTLQALAQNGYLQQLTLQSQAQTGFINQQKESEVFRTGILAKDYSNYDFRFEMEKLEHNKKVDQITEQILKSTAERYNLSWDSVLRKYEAAKRYIEMEILSYDFQYSKDQSIRSFDAPTKTVAGINLSQIISGASTQLKGALNSLMNWGGILGLPSFNDLGLNPFGINQ